MGQGPLLGVALLGQGSEQKAPEAPASLGHAVALWRPVLLPFGILPEAALYEKSA